MGYDVYAGPLDRIGGMAPGEKGNLVNTVNPHAYCVAKRDAAFRDALRASSVLLPDGVGIVWAALLLKGKRIRKTAGADLHQFMLRKLEREGGTCFYLGASQKTLDLIKAKLEKEYPNIKAGFYSPPYKPEFSEEDNENIFKSIHDFTTSPPHHLTTLFVGMTAPKQEKWAYLHRDRLDAKYICSIGAVFDFYAGTVKRSSPFWIGIGLEWLPRLLREPKRLYKRVFFSGPEFLWDLFLYFVRIKR